MLAEPAGESFPMKLNKITQFKRKLFIPGFTPKDLRNCVWKCTQRPESRFEDGAYQCESDRNRSFQDIWNICHSYFPECTMEEVMYHLARLCYKRYCIANWCCVIKRLVFYPSSIYDGHYPGNVYGNSAVSKALKTFQHEHSAEWAAEPKPKKKI